MAQQRENGGNIIGGSVFDQICAEVATQGPITEVPLLSMGAFDEWSKKGYPARMASPKVNATEMFRVLRSHFGSRPVDVRCGVYADPASYITNRKIRQMSLDTLLESIPSEEHFYLANQPISFEFLKGFVGSMLEELGGESLFESPALWVGSIDAVTPLHKDSTDNFAFHLLGKKKWTLFPPRDAPHLDLRSVNDRPRSEFCVSSYDLRNTDSMRKLLAAGAHPITCCVDGGQCLYVPAGWSHFVQTDALTVMINLWQVEKYPARILLSDAFK